MAERTVNVVGPGGAGSVSASELKRAQMTGDHVMTEAERAKVLEERKHAQDLVETQIAGTIGTVRGVGEAFGVPVDAWAKGFGGQKAADYLSDLKKNQPLVSASGELAGQVGGTIAGGELLGGEAAANTARTIAGRIAQGTAKAAVRGTLENLVIGSTSDVNERALGNPELAAEKALISRLPMHAAVGFAGGAVGGAAGETLGEAWGAFTRKTPGALEAGADRLVGREMGGDASLGKEIRGRFDGKVPGSAEDIRGALKAEQAAFRESAQADAAAAKETLLGRQQSEAWRLTAEQEAKQLKLSKEAQAALGALKNEHGRVRAELDGQLGEASSAAVKLEEERLAARAQMRRIASDLDNVKGATRPDPKRIIQGALEEFQVKPGPSLNPPSPRAVQVFSEWADGFTKRFPDSSSLSFSEAREVIRSLEKADVNQRVLSGFGSEPDVKRAFDLLRKHTQMEFDRASEATAAGISEAKHLNVTQLRDRIPELDKAHTAALDNVEAIQKAILTFDKQSVQEIRAAQRMAAEEERAFGRVQRVEAKALGQKQARETKELPKASRATPVDTLLGRVKPGGNAEGFRHGTLFGSILSLAHGNVAGAALSAVGGFAAATARANGNLTAARALSKLAEVIASADGSIAKLAGRAVGRYVRQGADQLVEDKPKRKEVTFEKASKQVRDAQSNPLILENKVRTMAGPWAQDAPSIYSAMMAAVQRQQEFLYGKLPPPRKDPYSLTPHLEPDELSDSEKYDFVQYAKAAQDPIQAMRDVIDGNGSPQQVEAVAAIYPRIYEQTKAEVMRKIAELENPLPYERAVNIGTLLQIDTTEVMTGEFQSMLSDMYSSRAKKESIEGGSKPRGVNSRLSKSMESAGQQMSQGGK